MKLFRTKLSGLLLCGLTAVSLSTLFWQANNTSAKMFKCSERAAAAGVTTCQVWPNLSNAQDITVFDQPYWVFFPDNHQYNSSLPDVISLNLLPYLDKDVNKFALGPIHSPAGLTEALLTFPRIVFENKDDAEVVDYVSVPGIDFQEPAQNSNINPVRFLWHTDFKLYRKTIVHDWLDIYQDMILNSLDGDPVFGFVPMFIWKDMNFGDTPTITDRSKLYSAEIHSTESSKYSTLFFESLPTYIYPSIQESESFYPYPDDTTRLNQQYVNSRSFVKSFKPMFGNDLSIPKAHYLPISVLVGKFFRPDDNQPWQWNLQLPRLVVGYPTSFTAAFQDSYILNNVGYLFYDNHEHPVMSIPNDSVISVPYPVVAGVPLMFVYDASNIEILNRKYPNKRKKITINIQEKNFILSKTNFSARDLYAAIYLGVKLPPSYHTHYINEFDKKAWQKSPKYEILGLQSLPRTTLPNFPAIIQGDFYDNSLETLLSAKDGKVNLSDFITPESDILTADKFLTQQTSILANKKFTDKDRVQILRKPPVVIRSVDGMLDLSLSNLDFRAYSLYTDSIIKHDVLLPTTNRMLMFDDAAGSIGNNLSLLNTQSIITYPHFYGASFIDYIPGRVNQNNVSPSLNNFDIMSTVDYRINIVNSLFVAPNPFVKDANPISTFDTSLYIPYSVDVLTTMDAFSLVWSFSIDQQLLPFTSSYNLKIFTPPKNSFMPSRAFVHIDTNLNREQLIQVPDSSSGNIYRRNSVMSIFEGYNKVYTASRRYDTDSALLQQAYVQASNKLLRRDYTQKDIITSINTFTSASVSTHSAKFSSVLNSLITQYRDYRDSKGITIWKDSLSSLIQQFKMYFMQALLGVDSYTMRHLLHNYYQEDTGYWSNIVLTPENADISQSKKVDSKLTILNFLDMRNLNPKSKLTISDFANVKGGLVTLRLSEQAMFHNGYLRITPASEDINSTQNQKRNYDDAYHVEIAAQVMPNEYLYSDVPLPKFVYNDSDLISGESDANAFHSFGGVFTASGPDIVNLEITHPVYIANYSHTTDNDQGLFARTLTGINFHSGLIVNDDVLKFNDLSSNLPGIDNALMRGFVDYLGFARAFTGYDKNDLFALYPKYSMHGNNLDLRMHNIEIKSGLTVSSTINEKKFNALGSIPAEYIYNDRDLITPHAIGLMLDSVNARVNYTGDGTLSSMYNFRNAVSRLAEMLSRESSLVILNDKKKPGSLQYVSINFFSNSVTPDYSGIVIGHDGNTAVLPGGIIVVDINVQKDAEVLLKKYVLYDPQDVGINQDYVNVNVKHKFANANFLRFYDIPYLAGHFSTDVDHYNTNNNVNDLKYAFTAHTDQNLNLFSDKVRQLYSVTPKNEPHALVQIVNAGRISYYNSQFDDSVFTSGMPFNSIMLGVPLFDKYFMPHNPDNYTYSNYYVNFQYNANDLTFADYRSRLFGSRWSYIFDKSVQKYRIHGVMFRNINPFIGTSITKFSNYNTISMNLSNKTILEIYQNNNNNVLTSQNQNHDIGTLQEAEGLGRDLVNFDVIVVSLGGLLVSENVQKLHDNPDSIFARLKYDEKPIYSPYYNQGDIILSSQFTDTQQPLILNKYIETGTAVSVGLTWSESTNVGFSTLATHSSTLPQFFTLTNAHVIQGGVRFLVGNTYDDNWSRTPTFVNLEYNYSPDGSLNILSNKKALQTRDLMESSFYNAGLVKGDVLFNVINGEYASKGKLADNIVDINLYSYGTIYGSIFIRHPFNKYLHESSKINLHFDSSNKSNYLNKNYSNLMIHGAIALLPQLDAVSSASNHNKINILLQGPDDFFLSTTSLSTNFSALRGRMFQNMWIGYPNYVIEPDTLANGLAKINLFVLGYNTWIINDTNHLLNQQLLYPAHISELFPNVPQKNLLLLIGSGARDTIYNNMNLSTTALNAYEHGTLHLHLSDENRLVDDTETVYNFNIPGDIYLFPGAELIFTHDYSRTNHKIKRVKLFSDTEQNLSRLVFLTDPAVPNPAVIFVQAGINVDNFYYKPVSDNGVIPDFQLSIHVDGFQYHEHGLISLMPHSQIDDGIDVVKLMQYVTPVLHDNLQENAAFMIEHLVIPLVIDPNVDPSVDLVVPLAVQNKSNNALLHLDVLLRPSEDQDVYYDQFGKLSLLKENEALVLEVNHAFVNALPDDYQTVRHSLSKLVPIDTTFPYMNKSDVLNNQLKLLPFDPSVFVLNHVIESLLTESRDQAINAFFVNTDRMYFNLYYSNYAWNASNQQEKYNLLRGLEGDDYKAGVQYFWRNKTNYYQLAWKFGQGQIKYVPEMDDNNFKANNSYILNSIVLKSNYAVNQFVQTNITGTLLHILHNKYVETDYLYENHLEARYYSLAFAGQVQLEKMVEVVKNRVQITPELFINFAYMSTPSYQEQDHFSSHINQKFMYAKEFPTRNNYTIDLGLGLSARIMDVNIGNNYLSMDLRTSVKASIFNRDMYNTYANYLRYQELNTDLTSSTKFNSDNKDAYQSKLHFSVVEYLRGESSITFRLQSLENEWTIGLSYNLKWHLQNVSHNIEVQFTITI